MKSQVSQPMRHVLLPVSFHQCMVHSLLSKAIEKKKVEQKYVIVMRKYFALVSIQTGITYVSDLMFASII